MTNVDPKPGWFHQAMWLLQGWKQRVGVLWENYYLVELMDAKPMGFTTMKF